MHSVSLCKENSFFFSIWPAKGYLLCPLYTFQLSQCCLPHQSLFRLPSLPTYPDDPGVLLSYKNSLEFIICPIHNLLTLVFVLMFKMSLMCPIKSSFRPASVLFWKVPKLFSVLLTIFHFLLLVVLKYPVCVWHYTSSFFHGLIYYYVTCTYSSNSSHIHMWLNLVGGGGRKSGKNLFLFPWLIIASI